MGRGLGEDAAGRSARLGGATVGSSRGRGPGGGRARSGVLVHAGRSVSGIRGDA